MRNQYLMLVMHFFCISIFAQSDYQVSYQNLKDYQGLYQYSNNTTLKIAASPKDTILYAIINQSRYPLKPLLKTSLLTEVMRRLCLTVTVQD